MSAIRVVPIDDEHFGVDVTEGTTTTHHKVAVPWTVLDEIGFIDPDPAEIVEATIAFLLDREPATALWPDFPLDQVAVKYPGFWDEIRTRLAA